MKCEAKKPKLVLAEKNWPKLGKLSPKFDLIVGTSTTAIINAVSPYDSLITSHFDQANDRLCCAIPFTMIWFSISQIFGDN